MEETYVSKYHRKEPIRKFDVDQSMYDLFKNVNENNMNKIASRYRIGDISTKFDINRYTFGKILNDSDRLAMALKNIGVNENEIVGVCILTVPEVSPIMLSINKVNAISYWMDASLGEEDLVKYINENKIKTMFLFEPLKPVMDKIIDKTQLEHVILLSPTECFRNPLKENPKDKRYIYYSNFIKQKSNDIIIPKYDRERPTIIVQSSGSTGKAKSIVHTDYNLNSEIEKMAYADLPYEVGTKSYVCCVPWIIYGLVNSTYSSMILGHNALYTIMPQEEMLYNFIGGYEISYGVPAFIRYLFNKIEELKKSSNEKDKKELSKIKKELEKMKVFISGGDKLSEEENIKWQLEFGTSVVNGYGNNELVGAAIVSPMYANKPGSIGIPMHCNLVKTFDPETGVMLPDGEEGELYVSSDSLFKYYLGNEEETKENKTIYDGREWVHTGDLGYVDKDGYVFTTGRSKRLIIDRLGFKISPMNSENVIQSLPYVTECVVVGVEIGPNDTVPMAFIELRDEYKENTDIIDLIEEECTKHMKDYDRPKIFHEIEKIPHKSNSGKADFKQLEELAKEIVSSNNYVLKRANN